MNRKKYLKEIPIELVEENPENPRIVFRQEELDDLLVSINKIGLQVPISVYKDKRKYKLIDGQRRLMVCTELNYDTIPAIVQEKPDTLENLLLMYNIHALREQWDYMTIANKIPRIIKLFKDKNGHKPNEIELSEATGLTRSKIRRCNLLIELPSKFKKIIIKELPKPKSRQIFTADFFLEMEQALKTVKRNYPEFEEDLNEIRDGLIKKYRDKIINDITDFRYLRKIATAYKNVTYDYEKARNDLNNIFFDEERSIEEVYDSSVAVLYGERQVYTIASSLLSSLSELDVSEFDDSETKDVLIEIRNLINRILKDLA